MTRVIVNALGVFIWQDTVFLYTALPYHATLLSLANCDFIPNSKLFSIATLVFELPPLGGVFYWKTIQSINLYRYVGAGGLVAILAELVCLIAFIIVSVKIGRQIKRDGWEFFKEVWNFSYLAVVALFMIAVFLYIWRCVLTVSTLEEVMNNIGKID